MDTIYYLLILAVAFLGSGLFVESRLKARTRWGSISILVIALSVGFIFTYIVIIPFFALIEFSDLTKQERLSQHLSGSIALPVVCAIVITILSIFEVRKRRYNSKSDVDK
jgi:hypothetical protein